MMLLNMAVADAYAIPFEFVPHSPDRPNDLKTYHRHPKYHELLVGQYTDDTQRSIGNAEVVLSGEIWNPLAYANAYVDQFRLDPREGYSRGFQSLMRSVTDGQEFMSVCRRERNSNGAVMGAAVLGFIHDPEMVKIAATIQACLTHLPTTAVHAQIVSLAANYMIYKRGSKANLFSWLMGQIPSDVMTSDQWNDWTAELEECTAPTTIQASSISAFVIGAIDRHDKMTDILKEAVDRGGDTDSAAASAIAVASYCSEISNDLPLELYHGLENGQYGANYLRLLDLELQEYAARNIS